MADHMYYKEKSFAFGITDGGLAGVERRTVFLNVGVCFVRLSLERDAPQFVLNPYAHSVLTVYVQCK
jgi:hypothetical protein